MNTFSAWTHASGPAYSVHFSHGKTLLVKMSCVPWGVFPMADPLPRFDDDDDGAGFGKKRKGINKIGGEAGWRAD